MTRAPSAILVVRHGARLDAADANWHLTSPAPYDTPLTYGGWNQAKALGARIANILSTRAAQQKAKFESARGTRGGVTDGKPSPPVKKQKVVIHTSPFLRCLQTSVAIAAGMAQSLELPEQKGKTKDEADHNENGKEDYSVKAVGLTTPDNVNIKTILRVDAFLGEWLSPDYFERMTPPPSSTMMVAAAKAALLRKEQIEVFQTSTSRPGYFPGGWSKANISKEAPATAVVDEDISLDKLSLMGTLHKQRSNSANSFGEKPATAKPVFSQLKPTKAAYDPPIPAYAVAPSDPIPRGYCGHARDACVDLDLLWDSMRFPQDWGDGGELGEEWSAMHKRFRRGLSKMIEWYTKHTPEFHPDREDPLALEHDTNEGQDDDYELTVILVTHAAGCNALVGALTNQPVLHDFGLTSLSMAVRKEPDPASQDKAQSLNNRNGSPSGRRRSSIYMDTADDYDMEIISSTNHLRAGARATELSALASPHLVPQIPSFASLSHPSKSPELQPKRAVSAALGSIRRPSITPSAPLTQAPLSPSTVTSSTSTGLWSRTSTVSSGTADEMPVLSIGMPAHSPQTSNNADRISRPSSPMNPEKAAKDEDYDEVPPLPSRSLSQRNWLWTAGDRKPLGPVPKRRWTVTEHDQTE
ncbi:uncharacterized protein PV09_01488 [Verruconis gallopava]|uniref:Phosphoglycerate mutase n=1 Tax=Verruconis gallopava TaxID=253628 RepID=A0A0D2AM48_9PEZI|nr:uncharacterized protein PV09_01488 [Verruconis gallopava]KIW07525.1 hypothetical protein PV09_01488 [Verruconis gallopava]